jgi:hypothetical protein
VTHFFSKLACDRGTSKFQSRRKSPPGLNAALADLQFVTGRFLDPNATILYLKRTIYVDHIAIDLMWSVGNHVRRTLCLLSQIAKANFGAAR